jgi:hypothetical protein
VLRTFAQIQRYGWTSDTLARPSKMEEKGGIEK